jgi:5'-nucleotidase
LGKDISLANREKTLILTSSNGIKVGIVALVEREWLDTINSLPPNLDYRSASATAKILVPQLREQGAEIIIAITHMREPNDVKLATNTPPGLIDIILGGHDHYYNHQIVNRTHILRSGSDFQQLSYIEAWKKSDGGGGWDFDVTRRDIVRDIKEDPATIELVGKLTSSLKSKLEKPIGYTAVPLDGRFTTVRTKESNLGNFVCDLMRFYYEADCAIMAGGTIRGDQVYPPGILKLKDIMNCFPFEDPVICMKVKGKDIQLALENGLSKLPALEGRFPQVSNMNFEFDRSLPEGKRIIGVMKICGAPIDPEKIYKLATRGYMGRGKDGYDSLLVKSEGGINEEIVDEENGLLISQIMRQYFMSLKVLGKWRRWGPSLNTTFKSVQSKMGHDGGIRNPGVASTNTSPTQSAQNMRSLVSAGPLMRTTTDPHIRHTKPQDTEVVDSDSDEDEDGDSHMHESISSLHSNRATDLDDHSKEIARKTLRKWLKVMNYGHEKVGTVADHGKEDYVNWTQGIAPKLEYRITVAGKAGDASEPLKSPRGHKRTASKIDSVH